MAKMKALITGGTGFIGKVLTVELLKRGNEVAILTREKRKLSNWTEKKLEIFEADICVPVSLGKLAFQKKNIDTIFHLAASLDYFGGKKELFRINVKGTSNLLNWARENKVKKFIFISSIEAMGMVTREDIPVDESYTCKPVSTYGMSKLEAEKKVRKFAEENNLEFVILRLGNVYGPGSQAFVLPIANAILREDNLGRFLPVFKDRYLHPVYIEDVIDGIIRAAQKNNLNGTYILAGEEYVTIETLFGLIAKELGVDIDFQMKKNLKDVVYLNLRNRLHKFLKKADLLTYFTAGQRKMLHRAYSIEKAKKQLGYAPKVSLNDGIAKTIKWAKKEVFIKS